MQRPRFIYAYYPAATSVTATDSAAGYDPADVLQADEDLSWRPANTAGPQHLVIDLKTELPLGSLGLAGEYLSGVTLEVRASSDNFASSNVQLLPPTQLSGNIAAWAAWTEGTYRYWRLTFTGFGASFEIYHAALCRNRLLPFMDDGPAIKSIKGIGKHLTSPGRQYLGSVQQGAEKNLKLLFGQVIALEEQAFSLWADACVRRMQGFFFVPDSGDAACYFGVVPDSYEYAPSNKLGRYNVGSITFTSRAD